jgi:glycosyltransferase involved in cell wall biosynthesis
VNNSGLIIWGLIWRALGKGKILHLNWILSYISGKGIKNNIRAYVIILWIKILKVLNSKIVWTMHNKIPHETKNEELVLNLRNFLIKNCDKIIIHCNSSKKIINEVISDKKIKEKVKYIPHGNYIGNYQLTTDNLRGKFDISNDDFVFLFLGHIRPYKNIKILIEVFKRLELSTAKLLICGKPIDFCLKKDIMNMVEENKDIIFISKFIPDDKIVKYLNTGDVLVLPYDKKSVLNSGAIYMGLSYGIPVIAPNIGTVKDMGEKEFIFNYDYQNIEEHRMALKKTMTNCYKESIRNKERYIGLKNKAFSYVKKENDWKNSIDKLRNIYKVIG